MAEFAVMIAEEYARKKEFQKPKAEKENADFRSDPYEMTALLRRLKGGVSEYFEFSTVKVVWGEKIARKEKSLNKAFVEGIFSAYKSYAAGFSCFKSMEMYS